MVWPVWQIPLFSSLLEISLNLIYDLLTIAPRCKVDRTASNACKRAESGHGYCTFILLKVRREELQGMMTSRAGD